MILGLAGELECGKDTVGGFLKKGYKFTQLAFAENLKRMCMKVFGLTEYQVYDTKGKEGLLPTSLTLTDKHISDIVNWVEDTNKINVLFENVQKMREIVKRGVIFKTPREVLQFVGTEICRNCIRKSFHIDVLKKKLEEVKDQNIIITDARFQNERDVITSLGGYNVYIHNPHQQKSKGLEGHESENSLGDPSDYDYVFINDKSLGLQTCEQQVAYMHTFLSDRQNSVERIQARLIYNLPSAEKDLLLAVKGRSIIAGLQGYDNFLRKKVKYGSEHLDVYEEVRTELHDQLTSRGIDIWEFE